MSGLSGCQAVISRQYFIFYSYYFGANSLHVCVCVCVRACVSV